MTTTRGIGPSPSRLSKPQRAAIGRETAPAVVPAPPFGGLGKGAARFEDIKEKVMEAEQTMTTDEMYADPNVVPGMTLTRWIGDKVYPYRPFEGAWYVRIDPANPDNWLRFETVDAMNAWFADRMAEEMARIDAVFASLDEAVRRIEARCEREDNSPARIRQEM